MSSPPVDSQPARRASFLAHPSVFAGIVTLGGIIFFLLARGLAPTFFFLSDEAGQNLMLADRLNAGETLYRDVFCQYGPLPIWLLAGVTRLFGSRAEVVILFVSFASLASLVLVGFLARRWLRPVPALVATLLLSGWILRNYYVAVYPPWEALFFLCALLSWRPPADRSVVRSALVGLCIGMMQWTKFGGAAFAGLCLVAADLLAWGRAWRARETWLRAARGLVVMGIGFLITEGALVAWAYAVLSPEDACELLWPSYIRASYASYVIPSMHFLSWRDRGFFAGIQWPPLAATAAGLLTGGLILRRSWRGAPLTGGCSWRSEEHARYAPLAVGLSLFFPLALVAYLPHIWVAMFYLWIPIVAAMGAVGAMSARAAWVTFVALLAGAWVWTIKPLFTLETLKETGKSAMTFPSGESLLVTADERATFEAVLARCARVPPRPDGAPPTLFIFQSAFGWEHYGAGHLRGHVPGFRHWWLMPAFVRPREEPALVEALDRADLVLVDMKIFQTPGVTPHPSTWGQLDPHLTPAAAAAFAARLGSGEELRPNLWCFPVRH